MNSIAQRIAAAVLRAMAIREESYDQEAADLAARTQEYPDFSKFYKLDLRQAATMAVREDEDLRGTEQLVYLMVTCAWNDAQLWANDTLSQPTCGRCSVYDGEDYVSDRVYICEIESGACKYNCSCHGKPAASLLSLRGRSRRGASILLPGRRLARGRSPL